MQITIRECRATGNHLAAQNDEPETILDQARAAIALADKMRAARVPDFLRPFPGLFVGPPAPITVNTPTVAEYTALLARHDWFFDRADDPSAYRAGRASFDKLVRLQELLDPARKLWSQYAPRVAGDDVDGLRKVGVL